MNHYGLSMFLDGYNRRARLRPLLIGLLPVALPLAAGLPAMPRSSWMWTLIVCSGLPLCADQLGRSRGKRIEEALFRSWGGKPTVQLLRWRGPGDRTRLVYFHEAVQRIIGPSLRLPTEAEELRDPQAADRVYDAAGLVLRSRARDLPGCGLVMEQNCEYGFRRNALGLRPYALATAVVGLLGTVAWLFVSDGFPGRPATAVVAALCVMQVGLVAFWSLLVRPRWVESAAWLYAERLLETSALPDQNTPPASPTG
ncbi:hypothetical protein ABZX90_02055 [Streptomyces sp. NPDC002935]|uniref:hypothetical protein n=1 Tax=unclassified Streptomyces TaxID=2593676 RepID=UPI0033216FFC